MPTLLERKKAAIRTTPSNIGTQTAELSLNPIAVIRANRTEGSYEESKPSIADAMPRTRRIGLL